MPQLFTAPDHRQERECTRKRDHACSDKAVLQSLRLPPRCDGVADAEADRVPDHHDRYGGLASNALEAIHVVADSDRPATHTAER